MSSARCGVRRSKGHGGSGVAREGAWGVGGRERGREDAEWMACTTLRQVQLHRVAGMFGQTHLWTIVLDPELLHHVRHGVKKLVVGLV